MNLIPSLGRGRALTSCVTFEDNGTVQDIATERKVQMAGWMVFISKRFHGWKAVDGDWDVRICRGINFVLRDFKMTSTDLVLMKRFPLKNPCTELGLCCATNKLRLQALLSLLPLIVPIVVPDIALSELATLLRFVKGTDIQSEDL